MKALPEWVMKGAIVGVEGGQKAVDEKYDFLRKHEVPLVGLWMQDWVGLHHYIYGDRLTWNWQLNKEYYYNWTESVNMWAENGVRPFVYLNPFFSDVSKIDNMRCN